MRFILIILLFMLGSFWLSFIISVGVNAGFKAFYKTNFQNKMEENKNKNESIWILHSKQKKNEMKSLMNFLKEWRHFNDGSE